MVTLIDALSGTTGQLATTQDLYEKKAFLVIGADLALEHPFLSFQIRASFRHHAAHIYTITADKVREEDYAVRSIHKPAGQEIDALEDLRASLAAEPELVILFSDSVKGDAVRKLVEFGQSLGIPVKYSALVDYSNSRGAIDMGLVPELLPGYQPSGKPGLSVKEMLASQTIEALWVVGANPLKNATLASKKTFVVVSPTVPAKCNVSRGQFPPSA